MAKIPDPGFGNLNTSTKRKSDKAPLYYGTITDPTGKTWELAGWLKSGSYGEFISLSIKEPYAGNSTSGGEGFPQPQESRQRASISHSEPFDDGVPFRACMD